MRPNRVLRWLLGRIASRDAAEATVGDLLEELDAQEIGGHPPRSPQRWLNKRMTVAVAGAAAAGTPTLLRTAGLTLRDAWRSLRRAPRPSLFIFLILAVAVSAATV